MTKPPQDPDQTSMIPFEDEGFDARIRRVQHDGRLFFSVVDVVGILTGAPKPRQYWFDMKRRISDEGFLELSAFCRQLKLKAPDGKLRATECGDVETMLRIVQSIPSPRAEPIKQWLAQVGTERLQELQDPSRAIERARKDYERLGYASEWIERRLQGQVIRDELTREWSERGASGPEDYAHLTDMIHRGTFDLSVGDHKQVKGLRANQNLRDNETVLELLLTAIGEETAKQLHQVRGSQDMPELQQNVQEARGRRGDTPGY